ncbi:5'-Nucleotidase domain protein [Stackebrandtia nassauensis DSM 44728]|uniref:5'-Nucleotidase domain protein n=1 Tax=Stackebrandtia nassauensis (strain DSM 44728 / CIP 108903 / NRRL B-16338 / NBRC 102104 / LLR-40K-21) TaxID=446470 RepID=D3Q8P5_STANL|nr:5'-Nucleotidase domain protein [Stackebrandtia nassauensis DSM 44728]
MLAGGTCLAALAALGIYGQAYADADPVNVQLLSITDFHRQFAPPTGADAELPGPNGEKLTVGGANYLAAHIKKIQEGQENSLLLSAGDQFGGYPYESWEYLDEPVVEAFNTMGVDVSTVGNHEIDLSLDYLKRTVDGTCFGEPGVDSCFDDSTGKRFHGSEFDMSSSNLVNAKGELQYEPYVVKKVTTPDGTKIPVGIINGTVTGTEKMNSNYTKEYKTTDLVEAVNKYAAKLKAKGVNAIVVNVHEGAKPKNPDAPYNGCEEISGPLMDAAAKISPDVDAIMGGHRDGRFNCSVPDPAGNPRFVIEAGDRGNVVNEMNLALDPSTGEVVREESTSENHAVTRDIEPDAEMKKVTDYWIEKGEKAAASEVAKNSGDISRKKDDSGESTLGNWAADINLAASEQTDGGKADFGLVATESHKGATSLNGDMFFAKSEYPGDADGRVTAFEVWKAYGFGNPILTVPLTGAQIEAGLEQQWTATKFAPLGVSSNVKYSFDADAAIGDRVNPADVQINGETLDPAKTYRVSMLAYTALGLDGFAAFKEFKDFEKGPHDQWFVRGFLKDNPELTPSETDRVSVK